MINHDIERINFYQIDTLFQTSLFNGLFLSFLLPFLPFFLFCPLPHLLLVLGTVTPFLLLICSSRYSLCVLDFLLFIFFIKFFDPNPFRSFLYWVFSYYLLLIYIKLVIMEE